MSERTDSTRRLRRAARVAIALLAGAIGVGAAPVGAAPCWVPPVAGEVVDPFREPPCPWCPGNRGIEYRVDTGTTVRVAASGRVEFAGDVAGVRYVVVRLANGWRHTYGRLASTPLATGDVVLAGTAIGRAASTFHFGLRIGDDYADPAPFIGVMRTRTRLVPHDATAPRPAPAAHPRCASPLAPRPTTGLRPL